MVVSGLDLTESARNFKCNMRMNGHFLVVSIASQELRLYDNNVLQSVYPVSTAANGPGCLQDSEKTPTGWHEIVEKVGEGAEDNAVFVGRQLTGEIYPHQLTDDSPNRDYILTRILRLKGLEPGHNLGGNVDSFKRLIYIHGTHENALLGKPGSRGCVRMGCEEIKQLFEIVSIGTKVYIC